MNNPLLRQYDQIRAALEQQESVDGIRALATSSCAAEYRRIVDERHAKLVDQVSGLGALSSMTAVSSAAEYFRQEEERRAQLLRQTLGVAAINTNDFAYQDSVSLITDELRRKEAERISLLNSTKFAIEAQALAQAAHAFSLGSALDQFRTSEAQLAIKLLNLGTLVDFVKIPAYLQAFTQASALADVFGESKRVDRYLQQASYEFAHAHVPGFPTLRQYGFFLDSSGLALPHWPSVRLLKIGDKRRRFGRLLQKNCESKDVRKGKSLVQRYELTLREVLDEVMTGAYGEDWPYSRLPLCDCKTLLGKSESRGGTPLDHADYAHYELIMIHPEHFEEIFSLGFDDPDALKALMKKAGQLRAKLSHFHPFSNEDLRDLRVTWRSIETGLLALLPDYDVDHGFG